MTNKKNILVTGANGQLGSELAAIASSYPQFKFLFTTRASLPIEDTETVERYFEQHPINFCINCAASTGVDNAESEREKAFLINGTAVGKLAGICKRHGTQLIHISADYVFDGNGC